MQVLSRLVLGTSAAVLLIACGGGNGNTAAGGDDDCVEGETVTTDSGLQYEDIECGSGEEVERGDSVVVHYVGTLENGKKFDSSRDRRQPFEVAIGMGLVIQGWDEGIPGMREGGIRKLTIPPELGYGAAGAPPTIPKNATLIFEVEVLEIKEPTSP